MHKIDLMCPSCSSVLRTKTDLDKIKPGVHEIQCDYCGYRGLLEIDYEEHVSLNDLEDQSYAKARGEYRARSEYERQAARGGRKTLLIFLGLAALVAVAIFFFQDSQKITINPFDYATVEFSGKNGEGTAELIKTPPSEDSGVLMQNITYKLSEQRDLSEGDQIVLSAESEDYKLSQSQKNITVEGLSIPLQDVTTLSPEARDVIHNQTEADLRSQYSKLAGDVQSIEYSPAGTYLVSADDSKNSLYDVMQMDITFNDGSTATYFGAISYNDIIVSDSDSPTFSYRTKWTLHGSVQSVGSSTETIGFKFIYSSLDAAKSEARSSLEGTFTEYTYGNE